MKVQELREKSQEELHAEVLRLQREHFSFTHAAGKRPAWAESSAQRGSTRHSPRKDGDEGKQQCLK